MSTELETIVSYLREPNLLLEDGLSDALSYWAGRTIIAQNWLGNGYATTFAFSFVLTSIGLMIIARFMREPEPPTVRQRMSLRDRFREFQQCWTLDQKLQ